MYSQEKEIIIFFLFSCCTLKNWFVLSVHIFCYGCTQEVGRAREKLKRVAQGVVESNSSFLSAPQTSQLHP